MHIYTLLGLVAIGTVLTLPYSTRLPPYVDQTIICYLVICLVVLKRTSVASFCSYYVMLHGCFLTCFLTLWFCFITTPFRSLYLIL